MARQSNHPDSLTLDVFTTHVGALSGAKKEIEQAPLERVAQLPAALIGEQPTFPAALAMRSHRIDFTFTPQVTAHHFQDDVGCVAQRGFMTSTSPRV